MMLNGLSESIGVAILGGLHHADPPNMLALSWRCEMLRKRVNRCKPYKYKYTAHTRFILHTASCIGQYIEKCLFTPEIVGIRAIISRLIRATPAQTQLPFKTGRLRGVPDFQRPPLRTVLEQLRAQQDCEECWICQDCWKKGSRS